MHASVLGVGGLSLTTAAAFFIHKKSSVLFSSNTNGITVQVYCSVIILIVSQCRGSLCFLVSHRLSPHRAGIFSISALLVENIVLVIHVIQRPFFFAIPRDELDFFVSFWSSLADWNVEMFLNRRLKRGVRLLTWFEAVGVKSI